MQTRHLTEIAEIEASFETHPGYRHEIWDWIAKGEFGSSDAGIKVLRDFALLYYEHVKRYRQYLFRIGSIAHSEKLERAIAGIIADEHGLSGAPSHPEMFRDFMRSLGLTESDWNQDHLLAGVEHFRAVHWDLFREDREEESLGAVIFAFEGTTPYRHGLVAAGLKKFNSNHGIHIDSTFFSSHVEIDPHHHRSLIEPIEPWFADERKRARMIDGIQQSFDARKVFLDDLARAIGLPC